MPQLEYLYVLESIHGVFKADMKRQNIVSSHLNNLAMSRVKQHNLAWKI